MLSSNHQGVISANFTMSNNSHAESYGIHSRQSDWLENSISLEIDRRVEQWSQQVEQTLQPKRQYAHNNGMVLTSSSEAIHCQTQNYITNPVHTSIQFQNSQVPLPLQPVSMTHLFSNAYPASNHSIARPHRAHISLVPNSTGGFRAVVKRKRKRTMFTTEQIEYLETIFSSKPYVTREERQVLVEKLQVSDSAVKVWFQNRRIRGKRENEHALIEYCPDASPTELSLYSSPNSVQESNKKAENVNYIKIDDETMGKMVTDNLSHLSPSEGHFNCQQSSSHLDLIETELKQRVDDLGFITLDDKVLGEIVSAIDNVLTGDINLNTSPNDETSEVPQDDKLGGCSCKRREFATEKGAFVGSAKECKSDEEESFESEPSSYADSIYEPISPAVSENADEETPICWTPFAPEQSLQRLFDLHFC